MSKFIFLLVVLSWSSSPTEAQTWAPCHGENCINVTVYLGPRWGSRVLSLPKTDAPGEAPRPQHRPVPPGEEFKVDFGDDTPVPNTIPSQNSNSEESQWSWWDPKTSRRKSEKMVDVTGVRAIDMYGMVLVNLSRQGYSGEDVKTVLQALLDSYRSRVNRLILDGNRIRYLPVMVFPVEFEYSLEELSLSGNLFNPSSLTSLIPHSYTRFELSRLANLQTLNMSHCGLTAIELPNLPHLVTLDLSYNMLTSLPRSLSRLESLLQLFLRGNKITWISALPLSSLYNLWVLDLGSNGLREIRGEPFEKLNSLVTVKLDHNRLESLPLLHSERTKVVTVANNSLQCSCRLLTVVGQKNVQLGYDYYERCLDGDQTVTLLDLKLWPEEHRRLCDDGWARGVWRSVALWYRRNPDIVRVVYQVVGVMAVVAVVAALLRRLRKAGAATKPGYNILDEQLVSTVSGHHYVKGVPI